MRLRNRNGKKIDSQSDGDNTQSDSDDNAPDESDADASESDCEKETWQPSLQGFLRYLVDSKLVFDTVERIVDDSNDVAC